MNDLKNRLQLRPIFNRDAPIIEAAFRQMGWNKPAAQYLKYVDLQARGERAIIVAEYDQTFAGYCTICWESDYLPFREKSIPEIVDLNVLAHLRKKGIATAILDEAEKRIQLKSNVIGIGVGLHPGYNAAQRLYAKRGYIPDGLGVTYQNRPVTEGQLVCMDDDLILHLTKVW